MKRQSLIKEKLFGQDESFFKYCRESGKKFVDELDREDFIAYRAEYAVPRAQIIRLQNVLGFRERRFAGKIPPPQDVSDGLNAFVFADRAALDGDELTANMPAIMHEKLFAATIEDLAHEKNCPAEVITAKLSRIYKHSGQFFHRGKLTTTFKCAHVLKGRFPNGYKIGNENFYLQFVRYMQEIFNEQAPPNQRALNTLIRKIGVLCDSNKYMHPDLVHVPREVRERVKNFIDASDRTTFFYNEIFETLRDSFVGTQITNHYFLQGVMKFYKLPYTFFNCYLTTIPGTDIGQEFNDFVAGRGEVSSQEIKENFAACTVADINFLLTRCPAVIRTGHGTFIHAKRLNLRANDFEPIKKFLSQNCSTPVNSRVLFDYFFERFADFMRRNEIQDHDKLFGVLQYMFRNDFNFSRPYISLKGVKIINNKAVLLDRLESLDEIEIKDLVDICAENGIRFTSRAHLIDSLSPEFVRVDALTLRRTESIGITDKIIAAVAERIRAAVKRNGGWLAAQNFDDYEWLPRTETPWNGFLLESVASLAANAPRRLKILSQPANRAATIFVSEKFAGDDFKSFLIKILSAEHVREQFQSELEIFNWLKARGLCNKTLPKFLADGKAFKILNKGRIGDLHVCLRMGQRYGRL